MADNLYWAYLTNRRGEYNKTVLFYGQYWSGLTNAGQIDKKILVERLDKDHWSDLEDEGYHLYLCPKGFGFTPSNFYLGCFKQQHNLARIHKYCVEVAKSVL